MEWGDEDTRKGSTGEENEKQRERESKWQIGGEWKMTHQSVEPVCERKCNNCPWNRLDGDKRKSNGYEREIKYRSKDRWSMRAEQSYILYKLENYIIAASIVPYSQLFAFLCVFPRLANSFHSTRYVYAGETIIIDMTRLLK